MSVRARRSCLLDMGDQVEQAKAMAIGLVEGVSWDAGRINGFTKERLWIIDGEPWQTSKWQGDVALDATGFALDHLMPAAATGMVSAPEVAAFLRAVPAEMLAWCLVRHKFTLVEPPVTDDAMAPQQPRRGRPRKSDAS